MRYKRGVVVVHNETTDAIEAAFTFGAKMVMGERFEPLCTSGVDGNHSTNPESGHYQARALDFGFRGWLLADGRDIETEIPQGNRDDVLRHVLQYLVNRFGSGVFFGQIETDHFHIQRNRNTF